MQYPLKKEKKDHPIGRKTMEKEAAPFSMTLHAVEDIDERDYAS